MLCKALLPLVSIGTCLSASAAPITVEQAKMAVHTWASARPQAHMDAKLGKSAGEASSVTNGAGEVLFHVIKLEGGGFVVTSADDTTGPVIAFSECEDLDRDPCNPLWALLNKDMSERRLRIPPRALNAAKGGEMTSEDEWADLLGRKSVLLPSFGRSSVSDVRVPVLLKTKWGQGEVNGETTYNYRTPNNYVCGCVATAGAQLMRYHRYPASLDSITNVAFRCWVDGKSSTRYPYSLGFNESEQFMPDDPKLTFSDLSGTKALDFLISRIAFGNLLYSVGVISRMNWTRDGSGAQLFVLADAMVDYCGYANAKYNVRPSGVSSSVLKNAVYANLDAKCPVLLGIADSSGGSGHAIVADGYGYYNSKVYTHLNLGWSGDSDAWYALPMITDAGGYDFTLIQDVVFNVFPQKTDELITGRVLSESGTPCKSMTVKATCGSLEVTAQTDSKGIYALNVRGGRTWKVGINATGFETEEQSVYVDESVSTSCSLSADGSAYVSTVDVGTVGNVWGVDFTAMEKIDPPDTPRNVTATEDSSTQVKVSWSAAARAEKYLILRWDGTAEGMEDAPVFETTATSYIDKTGVPGVRYYYIVMAENRAGTSSYDDFEYAEGMRLVSVSVSPTAKTVLGAGGNYSVSVTANTDWEASTTTGWITLSGVTSGSGNGTVSYVVPPNTTTSARSGSITIFAGAGTEDERTSVLEVSQNRSPVSVTFDAAGGLPTGEVRKLEVGSAYGALPSPSRLGYSLAGWCDGETQVTASSLVPSHDVILRAKWRANTSSVSFHSEHLGIGAGSMADQTFDYGTSAALAGCGFTRVGYAFAGWATEQGGPVRYRDGQDILNLSAEDGAKLDFYAVWEEGKPAGSVKVTACAAAPRWPWNGKVDVDYTLACEPATGKATVKLTARDDDRQRDLQPKTLAGDGARDAVGSGTHRLTWDVAADYPGFDTTALDINVEASVETIPAVEGVTASQGTSECVELSWSPVDKAVAYEIWRSESDDVQSANLLKTVEALTMEDAEAVRGFRYWYWVRPLGESVTGAFSDSIGGCRPLEAVAGLTASAGHVVQGKVALSWNPVNSASRYEIFRGTSEDFAMATKQVDVAGTSWADESALEDVRYYYWVVAVGEQSSGMQSFPVCGYWERKQVTIAFDGNGTDLGLAAFVRKEGDKVGPLPSPDRVGYDFSGWYTAASGGQKLTEDSEVAGSDMTVHAHWTAHTYTVVFDGVEDTMPSVKMTYDVPTRLPLRTYSRDDALFMHWTYAGGDLYDHQTVVNLTAENEGVVRLSADWLNGESNKYLVIDISAGPNASSYPHTWLTSIPAGGWSDEYKTDKIVLRRIEAGAFLMGSPKGEPFRYEPSWMTDGNEDLHEVIIDHWIFVGVFEITEYQYWKVTGTAGSGYSMQPVRYVTGSEIANFIAKICAKTVQSGFDNDGFRLPTEAEWEYACRAGTETGLNSGEELASEQTDSRLARIGKHYRSDAETWFRPDPVGSYAPNSWGLYDMHGNIAELCFDEYRENLGTATVVNPKEWPDSTSSYGSYFSYHGSVVRGGSYNDDACECRSASRERNYMREDDSEVGFRLLWSRWL